MLSWLLVSLVLMLCQACPEKCNCSLDEAGRRQLYCAHGGLHGSLPIGEIDPSTEVLRITAPEDNENCLTIGPIFQGLQNLQEVHVTRSNVPAIGKHSFWGVPTLTVLNLTMNNITQVLDYNFRGLMSLHELYLDNNAIESMVSGTFQDLPELRVLGLSANRLKSLARRLFLKLGKLQTLNLSHNDLENLDPQVFKDVQELRTFSCRNCNLRTMNPHIYSLLPNLSHLDLGDNQFKYLDREAFLDLRNLVSLKIDGNHFPVIMDGTFQNQGKLEELNLARSEIAKITNHAFDHLTSLVNLDLSYNKLERIEPVTMRPPGGSLRYLKVSGNNIRAEEFALVLQNTPKLRKLDVADLDMEDGIPLYLLASVMGLKHLNLSGSRLSRFPVELLYPVASLSSLDLSRNLLHALDEKSVSRLSYIARVYLADNPWLCDLCHIPAMMEVVWTKSALCSDPPRLRGRSLASLDISDLAACDSVLDVKRLTFFDDTTLQFILLVAFSATAFTVLLLIGTIIGVSYTRRHSTYYTRRAEAKKKKEEKQRKAKYRKKSTVAVIDDMTKNFELTPLNSMDKTVDILSQV